jgi:hypothetical protein
MNTLVVGSSNEQDVSPVVARAVLAICLGWFVAVLGAALSGGFDAPAGEQPLAILMAVTMPVIMSVAAYYRIKPFREWALSFDMRQLILLHSRRMVGTGFCSCISMTGYRQCLPCLPVWGMQCRPWAPCLLA